MRTIHLIALFGLMVITSALASGACQELPPLFPSPHISAQQLADLLAEVKGRPGVECRPFGPHQVMCGSNSSHELWWLTEEGHPAHPAASRGRMETNAATQETCLVRDGYFAGPEEAFAQWFRELKRYDEKTIESFRSQLHAT